MKTKLRNRWGVFESLAAARRWAGACGAGACWAGACWVGACWVTACLAVPAGGQEVVSLFTGEREQLKFFYDAFKPTAAVRFTNGAMAINVREFGGAGSDLGPIDLDPEAFQLRVVYRPGRLNRSERFNIILGDQDGGGAESYHYHFKIDAGTPLEDESGFVQQQIPLADWAEVVNQHGKSSRDNDGVLNPGLNAWHIQSVFGATDRLQVQIRRIELVSQPTEPVFEEPE